MRILFVVKEYLPKTTPTGLCIMNVQQALYEKGVQSDVLMVGEEEGLYKSSEIGNVYSIKSNISFEKGKEGLFRYLKTRLPMVFTWPIPSLKRVQDYRRVIQDLNNKNHYDAIVGTMFPPDVCVACSTFNHFFYYELDSLINNPMYKEGFKKHFQRRLFRLEHSLFNKAELIIHLNNNREFYNKEQYKKYTEKSVYTDIPNLIDSNIATKNRKEQEISSNHKICMVYSGLLSKEYRSPTKLIELVKNLSKYIDIECLFFSRGDCEDELRKAEFETNGTIKRMGYVSREVLNSYTSKADFLLDIGNCLSGEDYSLPSKVICYMATGKPIIHLKGKNDSAIAYLDRYGLAINVDNSFPMDKTSIEVLKFIKENLGKRIPYTIVEKTFPQNTPAYTADLIINQIKKRQLQ